MYVCISKVCSCRLPSQVYSQSQSAAKLHTSKTVIPQPRVLTPITPKAHIIQVSFASKVNLLLLLPGWGDVTPNFSTFTYFLFKILFQYFDSYDHFLN